MGHRDLARSYLSKAKVRLKALDLFFGEGAYSDVVREAQETVEIALKGILWNIGVEPPKIHDVGGLIIEYRSELPDKVGRLAVELARISKWLRKEREFALYGAVDLVPSLEYGPEQAEQAMRDARVVVEAAELCIDPGL